MPDSPRSLIHRSAAIGYILMLVAACSSGGETGDASGAAGQPSSGGTNSSGAAAVAGASGSPATGGLAGAATAGAGELGGAGHDPGSSGGGGTDNGQAGSGAPGGGSSGQTGAAGSSGGAAGSGGGALVSSCVGKRVPSADPTKLGPFATVTDANVGPVAGAPNDPIHGNTPVKFKVYRPMDLDSGGYCFPIVIWSNGHGDQPEPSAPECVLNKCGHYSTLMQQFASHGFVVVVSLSSQTSQGTPVPSMVGLDWIVDQSNDASSPYYHHLDTAHIGAAGHSEGGFATCGKMASDPRISAISTVAGSSANPAIHQPVLLECGGKDPTVPCSGVEKTFGTISNYPAMLLNNLSVNHVNWTTQGASGPSIAAMIAWFRVHLMSDSENRKFFYGPSCTFCSDARASVMRNNLMTQ